VWAADVPRRGGRPPLGTAARPALAVLAAAAVAMMALAGCGSSAAPDAAGRGAGASRDATGAVAVQQAFVSVVRRVLPSVVEIRTESGLGSGVVFGSSGDIVTNAHVVGDATKFEVLASGERGPLDAGLVGVCKAQDLAVIKVSAADRLRPASFVEAGQVVVGDLALALGSPLGLDGTVTEGIVSAVGRDVTEPGADGSPGATLHGTIQTSAAINPGNSGGALVDIEGQVIGIPTLAAAGERGSADGIGFAIPASTAVAVARELVSHGSVGHPVTCS
jgi:putative serine protease PepD